MKPMTVFALFCMLFWGTPTLPAEEKPTETKPVETKPAQAEPAATVAKVDIIELSVYPAEAPRPALKYRLTPPQFEREPGDALPFLAKAMLLYEQRDRGDNMTKNQEKAAKWLDMPIQELPRQEVRDYLNGFQSVIHQAELAAKREHCQWDPPLREEEDIFGILLPEIQTLRNIGRLLALKVRLQIAERDYDGAIKTLQTGVMLARHASAQPFLISGLVGIATQSLMNQQAIALMQAPEAPNLYWAIGDLPSPAISLKKAFDLEAATIDYSFPELRTAHAARHSNEQWQMDMARFFKQLGELGSMMDSGPNRLQADWQALAGMATAAGRLPQLKSDLIKMGVGESELAAMPLGQIVLLHVRMTYEDIRDESFKWFSVPYHEAHAPLKAINAKLRAESGRREIVPLAGILLPALDRALFAAAKLDRHVAAMRIMEALRAYAAEHDGKLPASLTEIEGMPIPTNPVTGKPFPYRLDGDTAILTADAPDDLSQQEYHIKIAK